MWERWCKRLFPLKEAPAAAEEICGQTSAGGCLERGGGRRGEQRGGEKQEGECLRSELRQMLTVKRRGDRCTAIGGKKGKSEGVRGGVG